MPCITLTYNINIHTIYVSLMIHLILIRMTILTLSNIYIDGIFWSNSDKKIKSFIKHIIKKNPKVLPLYNMSRE